MSDHENEQLPSDGGGARPWGQPPLPRSEAVDPAPARPPVPPTWEPGPASEAGRAEAPVSTAHDAAEPADGSNGPDEPTAVPGSTGGPIGDITPGEPLEPDAAEKKKGSFFRELPILILIAFGLAMLIKTFFVQAFYIPSESMVPTLIQHDRVLVNKIVYRIRDPRRGEIIVFVGEKDETPRSFLQRVRDVITEGLGSPADAEKDFIKRVIALPGETVEVTDDGAVFVTTTDGQRMQLEEPYLAEHDPEEDGSFGPFTVPADSYFVMGDNRDNSADSRTVLGPIAKEDIVGKAFVRIWPVSRFGFFRTPGYGSTAAGIAVVGIAGLGLRRRRAA